MTNRRLLQIAGVLVILVVWEIAGRILGDMLFAPPSEVFPTLVRMLGDGRTLPMLAGSLGQAFFGFLLACAVGMPLGIAMGRSKFVDALFHPWVGMIVVTSIAALAPIFILVLGTGPLLRIAIVFAGSVGYIVLTTYQGALGIEARYINAARAFSVTGFALFRKVLLPAVFPYLTTAARLGLVHAIRAMVVAEMFVISGFGGLMYHAGMDLSVAPLMAYLILLMFASLGANFALRALSDRIAPWYAARLDAPR